MAALRQTDVIRAAISGLIPQDPMMHVLLILLLAVLLLFLLLLPVMIHDGTRFVTREYTVLSDKVRGSHTLVFLTDLHGKIYGGDDAAVLRAIRDAHPELAVAGGDLVTASEADPGRKEWYRGAAMLLRPLAGKLPIYFCLGNHERKIADPEEGKEICWEEYCRFLEHLGIRIRRNDHTSLEEAEGKNPAFCADSGIDLWSFEAGREEFQRCRKHRITREDVAERLGNPDPDRFHVVVTHHPAHFDACAAWGADLCLCGHIHGGVMRLPGIGGVISPDFVLFPKYSGGRYEIHFDRNGRQVWSSGRVYSPQKTPPVPEGGRRSVMILGCGLGFHTIPIRIFNPAELSVIHIEGTARENGRKRVSGHFSCGYRDSAAGGADGTNSGKGGGVRGSHGPSPSSD